MVLLECLTNSTLSSIRTSALSRISSWRRKLRTYWLFCKLCDETGEILLIILWMSYFLRPHSIGLLIAAKTVSSQKKGHNLTSFIAQFTDGETHMADSSRPMRPADEIYKRFGSAPGERV